MKLALLTPLGEGQLGPSLARGLRQAGHSVTIVEAAQLTSDTRLLNRLRAVRLDAPPACALARLAAGRVAAVAPDAVVVIRGRFLSRRAVELLRAAAVAPVVNLYTDNPLYGRLREPRFLRALPAYDLVTLWSERLATDVKAAGARRTCVVQFGYDPALYAPAPRPAPEFDVCFVGGASPLRVEHMRRLTGLRLALSGPRWGRLTRGTELARAVLPDQHWGAKAAALMRSSRVGLNVVDPQNLIGHNMRTWELPATGTPMVATRTPDHERLFAGGGAVLFDGPEGVMPAVRRLLDDPAERAAVGTAGRRAVKAGTYEARGRELVEAIEGLRPAM